MAIFKELTLAGVQLFISTHSYFILHWMALVAQYFKDEIDIRCFTIQTDAKENITSHNLKNGIPPQNRIIEEADLILDKYLGL